MSFIARLCDRALLGWPAVDAEARACALDAAAVFVEREIALAPAHIRAGIRGLGVLFRAVMAVSGGDPDRAARLAPPLARYWQLVRQLAILAYLEHPAVLDAIGMTHGAARQEAFRAARRRAVEAGG